MVVDDEKNDKNGWRGSVCMSEGRVEVMIRNEGRKFAEGRRGCVFWC